MTRYSAEGFRSVLADSPKAAAEIFGKRLATRRHGKRGTVGACRLDSYTTDGSMHQFELFIGSYDPKTRHTTGRNEWIAVRVSLDA